MIMKEKEILKCFYEEVISHNEVDRIKDFISTECVVRIGEESVPIGVAGIQEHIKATKTTYPDYTMKITHQYQEDNVVISEFIMTGTHKGVFVGIKPTNKVLSITGVNIDKVVDGKIVEHGGAANTFETFFENHLIKPV
jgi:predicted ester cyclase